MVDTGGKSIHCYWVLKKPVAAEVWKPIQIRLVDYCKADKNIKDASRCMRLRVSTMLMQQVSQQ